MQNIFLIFFLLYITTFNSSAQIITFEKLFGSNGIDESYFVMQTYDNGYIVVGNTNSFGNNYDIYLIKTNSYGDTIWTKTYGGSNWEGGRWVQQTLDSGYIVTGSTISFGAGNSYLYLIKTNVIGETLWTKTIGDTSDNAFGNCVQQTSDNGYIITGGFGTNTITDFFLVKTNLNGDTIWTKKYKGIYSNSSCFGKIVKQTTDGGFIIVGSESNSTIPANLGWLIKTDSNGDTLWAKNYSGLNYAKLNSLQETTDGGFMLVGYSQFQQFGAESLLLLKTDYNGNTIWTKTFDSFLGESIKQTDDGGFIIAGITDYSGIAPYDLFLLKIDSFGDTLWSKTFGGSNNDWCYSAMQTLDKGYVLTGSLNKGSDFDILLIKTDSAGKILTSINQNNFNKNLIIFPNPTTDILFLTNTSPSEKWVIYDIIGQEIIHGNEAVVDMSGLSKGIYYLKGTQFSFVKTVIKQ